ncbi:MAG: hypothetical protein II135_01555 [Clostridia bacterium]|nr:hypothetical protein [Clostridia bacterium]
MKFLKWAGAHLRDACIYFTVFQFAVTAIFHLTAENGGRGQFLIFGVELAVFAFSFALACAADILKIKKISLPLRILIHFLCCIAAVSLLFRIVAGDLFKVNSLLFIVLGFALIYIVIAAAALLILHVKNKKISDDSEYESMFKGKKE